MENTQNANDSAEAESSSNTAKKYRWSWGAFMFDPAFLIAIRKYWYLLLYLLYLIPLLNLAAVIGIKIFLGLKGSELAAQSSTFADEAERRGFMKGLDHAGWILFLISVAALALGFLGTFAFGTGMFFGHFF